MFFVLVLFSSYVYALPGDWWGKVIINGDDCNNGSLVEAYINDTIKVSNTTVGLVGSCYYLIHVDGHKGDMVYFRVNGLGVNENPQAWSFGGHDRLDLTLELCFSDDDCNSLDNDYCEGDLIKHDEGRCVDYVCEAETTTIYDCNDDNGYVCNGDLLMYEDYGCSDAVCVLDESSQSEDCNGYDGLYCNGDEVWEDDGYCLEGTCKIDSNMLENCDNYDGVYCLGTEIWNKNSYCLAGACETDNSMIDDCDNGLYCDGQETCQDDQCIPGTNIECTENNKIVSECSYNPDNIDFTFDFYSFISVCEENPEGCTIAPEIWEELITHECSIIGCDADCEIDEDCDGTYCTQISHKTYPNGECQDDCSCKGAGYAVCVVGSCDAECDEESDCSCAEDYCDGLTLVVYPDYGYCGTSGEDGCLCQTGAGQGEICEPTLTEFSPLCGACYSDEDCDNGLYCDGQETCDLVTHYCEDGTAVNCNDEVSCTEDSCNESADSCDNTPNDNLCSSDTVCADYYCDADLDCQVDYEPDITECRASAGVCDTEEYCTGSSADCPADDKSTGLCRQDAGECDVEEYCDGINNDCPADAFEEFSTPCDDGLYCSETDHCDGNGNCVQLTERDCLDSVGCTDDVCNESTYSCEYIPNDENCDDDVGCTYDVCDAQLGCQFTPDDSLCDNGLWCDGFETCDIELDCQPGTAIDCSENNICPIGTCFYSPDNIDFTWDFFGGFTSVCDDINDECTTGIISLTHSCSAECGADCETDNDCQSYCVGDTSHYGSCLSDCVCSWQEEDCNLNDGWYNTGTKEWVNINGHEEEKRKQKYRDCSCSEGECVCSVTETRWVSTGRTREKPVGGSIFIDSIRFDDDFVNVGDDLVAHVRFKNTGDGKIKGITVSMVIQDLAVWTRVGPFDLGKGKTASKHVVLTVPEWASEGWYDVRIVIQGEGIRRIRHRPVYVEG